MRKIFLDCSMGAAGDMLTAALLELTDGPDEYIDKLNSLGIPGVEYVREKTEKCGITGTHISVRIHGAEEGEDEGGRRVAHQRLAVVDEFKKRDAARQSEHASYRFESELGAQPQGADEKQRQVKAQA